MIILAIDTSTPHMGVALLDEHMVLGEHIVRYNKGHSRRLVPAIKMLIDEVGLKGSDIGGIAVSVGPGSFTGIRIGISTAQGLAFGWKIGVFPVCSLDVLVRGLWGFKGYVCTCLKARKGRVYAALYDGVTLEKIWGPADIGIDSLLEMSNSSNITGSPMAFVGDGSLEYWSDIVAAVRWAVKTPVPLEYPRPSWVGLAAMELHKHGLEPELLRPLYLRPPEAQVNMEKSKTKR